MTNDKKLRNKLKEVIKENGITYAEISGDSGIFPCHISTFFTGDKSPTLNTVFRVMEAAGIDVDHMINNIKMKDDEWIPNRS